MSATGLVVAKAVRLQMCRLYGKEKVFSLLSPDQLLLKTVSTKTNIVIIIFIVVSGLRNAV